LLHMAQQLKRLVSFYQFVCQEHQIPPTYSTVVADNLNSSQVGPHTSYKLLSSCGTWRSPVFTQRSIAAFSFFMFFLIIESFSCVYFITVPMSFL
jgi:hypothetical protein